MSKQYTTVAYRLFHELFYINLKNNTLYNESHMRIVPGMASGNKELDDAFFSDYTAVARTPVGMVLLFDKGIPLQFTRGVDIATVYNLLQQHLKNWADIINDPLKRGRVPPPKEDLLMMENFAQHISFAAKEEERRHYHITGQHLKQEEGTIDAIFGSFLPDNFLGNSPLTITRNDEVANQGYVSPIRTAWERSPWGITDGNS